ncbi:MAG: MFS transporter [Pseudomonadaceae bacterium]|nr:MFS transporter [Pseudomonadaceae bacterium]
MVKPSGSQVAVTGAAFLAYFAMSGMLAPIGLISPVLAEQLQLPLTEVTASFSWLTVGILVGSGLALVVLTAFPLRWLMLAVYVLAAAAIGSLWLADSTALIWPALGVVGVSFGVGLAGAALSISRLYRAESRASMLVVTDACFSIAGTIIAWCAVQLIAGGAHWSATYQIVAAVCLAIAIIAVLVRFPHRSVDEEPSDTLPELSLLEDVRSWPMALWLCIISLFLYTLGQYAMLWWLPSFLTEFYTVAPELAGSVVGRFWTGMLIAQLFVAWWVYRVGVANLVLIGSITTALASLPLWHTGNMSVLPWLALLWGFANLGLLKMVLSFGTQTVREPSPAVVSALLFGATSGTALSPWLTSNIVEMTGMLSVLQFSSFCYFSLILLLFSARRLMRTDDTLTSEGSTL